MTEYATIPSAESIYQNALDHGWYTGVTTKNMKPYLIPARIALIHSELSRGLEAYLEHGVPERGKYALPGEDALQAALADAVIQIFDLCGFLGLDIETTINLKHEYDRSLPYRPGNTTA